MLGCCVSVPAKKVVLVNEFRSKSAMFKVLPKFIQIMHIHLQTRFFFILTSRICKIYN